MVFRVILSFLFLGVFASCAHAPKQPDGINEPIPVTFEEILKNPVYFHEKRVKFKAFLSVKGIYNYFFPTAEHFYPGATWPELKEGYWHARGLKIESEFPDNLLNINRTNVELVGTFIADEMYLNWPQEDIDNGTDFVCLDYCGDGTIQEIESLTVLNRPYFSNDVLNKIFSSVNGEFFLLEKIENPQVKRTLENFWEAWIAWLNEKDLRKLVPWIPREYCGETEEEMIENCGGKLPEYLSKDSIFQSVPLSTLKQVHFFQSVPNRESIYYDIEDENERSWAGCFCIKEGCEKNFPPLSRRLFSQSIQDDYLCLNFYEEEKRIVWNPIEVLYFYAIAEETSE